MSIQLHDHKVLKSLMEQVYHPKLIALAMWVSHRYSNGCITSAWREDKVHANDSGIHCTVPCRALDWSIRGIAQPLAMADDINNHWEYDPTRPEMKCAVVHDIGLGMHLHTQVHEATKYFKEGKKVVG